MIGRRGLPAEDLHPRHPVAFGVAADLVIERHRLDQIEQLALVFMDALDLHIKQCVGIEPDAGEFAQVVRQIDLVGALDLVNPLSKGRIARKFRQAGKLLGLGHEAIADAFADQAGEARVRLMQPAARGHPVGLVVDPVRVELVEIGKHRLLHQIGVQRGDPIDRMRANKGEVRHPHAPLAMFVD